MDKLYVCKEYEDMFTEGFKIVESLEEHDKRVIQNYIDKIVEELKNQSFVDNQLNRVVDLDEAIEIVKSGGIDD